MKSSIKYRLGSGFGVCLLLLVVVVGLNYLALNRLESIYNEVLKRSTDMELATDAQHIGHELYEVVADALINRDLAQTERDWSTKKAESLLELRQVAAVADTPEEHAKVAEGQKNLDELVLIFEREMLPLIEKGTGVPQPIAEKDEQIDRRVEAVAQNLSDVAKSMSNENQAATRKYHSVLESSIRVGFFLSIISITIAVFISTLIIRRITHSVSGLVEAAGEIEKGNYSIELDTVSNDEFKTLEKAFKSMSVQIEKRTADLEEARRELERKVKERTAELSEANNRLRDERHNLSVMLDSMNNCVHIINPQYDLQYINPVTRKEFGPVDGRKCYQYFAGREDPCPGCRLDQVLAGKSLQREWHSAKNNRTYDIFAAPVTNHDGSISQLEIFHDVTERESAYEKLREREERLKEAQSVAHIGHWELDLEGNRLSWSDELFRIFGLEPQEFSATYEAFLERVHPDDRDFVNLAYTESVRNKSGYDIEHRILLGSGNVKYVNERCRTVYDRDGNPLRSIGTTQDVTMQRMAEKALLKSEERYRSLVIATSQMIWTTSATGEVMEDIPSWRAFTGQSEEEVKGWGWCRALHPDDLERTTEIWSRSVRERAIYETEYRVRRHDREYRYFTVKGVPVLEKSGAIREWVGTCTDTTAFKLEERERARAEEALRKLSRAVEQSPVSVIITDQEGNIEFINPHFSRTTGYSHEEVIGKNPRILKSGETPDEMYKQLWATISSGNIWRGELHNKKKNGELFWESATISPVKNSEGGVTHYVAIKEDITERRKLEDQLRHAQKMEAIGTLAGGVAHDFNNILNVIIGYGTMLLDRLEDDRLAREQLNEVLAAADRAANLTKRLLAFSRKQMADKKQVKVNEIVVGMEKMLSRIIGEDVVFAVELAGKELNVLADAGQIEQVLMNLVTNARDAMPKGGRLTISTGSAEMDEACTATQGYGKAGMYALITVSDTGGGIDAETQKKIFEPFFTTKGIGEGTGLGLAIAYGIIKQHDGYIQVFSEVGRGTTFKILLPVMDDMATTGSELKESVPVKGGMETILIAEDDASLRVLYRIVLESFGYRVIIAEDGEEAISKYLENRDRIQLVILDMIMPKKNGKEACEELRKITHDIKVLFVSGYTRDIISKTELFDTGMDVLLKPASPQDLLKKVRELLDKRADRRVPAGGALAGG